VAAAVSQSTTVFANVTGLTFAVAANTTYSFGFYCYHTTAAAGTALQLALNGPAAPTDLRYSVETYTTATATHLAVQTAYDTNTNPSTGAGATPLLATVTGTITTGAASGTLALRYRSELNASAVTILRGSWGFWS
jgi:hypothetical protein